MRVFFRIFIRIYCELVRLVFFVVGLLNLECYFGVEIGRDVFGEKFGEFV